MLEKSQILAHRGFWLSDSEKNTVEAFERAIQHGFGIETDLRDHNNSVVVSHDCAGNEALSLEEFLELFPDNYEGLMGLNVKADGISDLLKQSTVLTSLPNAFYFDMSIPETIRYMKAELPFAIRQSDFETVNEKLPSRQRITWLDAFESEWYLNADPQSIFAHANKVVLVSPELHGREVGKAWDWAKSAIQDRRPLTLCTDFPLDLYNYLNG